MTKVDDFINEMIATGKAHNTVRSQRAVLKALETYKPINSITKDDLVNYMQELRKLHTEGTFSFHQMVIKKFFNHIKKPELVDWIQKVRPKETLKSDDILTTDDINKLIETADSHYWKALIAFLFETGARINEVLVLKYKDFKETTDGMIVHIPTSKTNAGDRKVILPFSSQYLRNLKTYTNANDNDIVFHIREWQSNNVIKIIAKKAGITKPISVHKFRHAQATDMVRRGYNEAIIRKKLGWTPTSTTIVRYVRLNDSDVIDATLLNHGKELPKTARIEIKEAQKLTLVDAASQFSKLSEENESLKQQVAEQKEILQLIQKKLGIPVMKNDIKRELESVWTGSDTQ